MLQYIAYWFSHHARYENYIFLLIYPRFIEYSKNMSLMGIDQISYSLCENDEIEPGLKPERQGLLENLDCFRRLLNDFLPKIVDAYCKMNEFFER